MFDVDGPNRSGDTTEYTVLKIIYVYKYEADSLSLLVILCVCENRIFHFSVYLGWRHDKGIKK